MLKFLSEIRPRFLSHAVYSLPTTLHQMSRVPTIFLETIYKKMSNAYLDQSRMGTVYEPVNKMYIAALTSTVHIQSNKICNKSN
jgi:hypothetical protein